VSIVLILKVCMDNWTLKKHNDCIVVVGEWEHNKHEKPKWSSKEHTLKWKYVICIKKESYPIFLKNKNKSKKCNGNRAIWQMWSHQAKPTAAESNFFGVYRPTEVLTYSASDLLTFNSFGTCILSK